MTGSGLVTTLEKVFLFWLVCAFIGWVWETGLSIVLRHRFEDRGVLNGPLCPIYGFGGLLVVALLHDVTNPVALFLSSGVIACTLEYLSSWAIERLFHVRLWDYTGKPLNINGRVYGNGFLAFGAGATAIKLALWPWMMRMLGDWHVPVLHAVAGVLFAGALVDGIITVAGLMSFDSRLSQVAEDLRMVRLAQAELVDTRIDLADERLHAAQGMLREQGERARERVDETKARLDAVDAAMRDRIRHTLSWQQRRLIRIFPSLASVRDSSLVERLRGLLDRRERHER